VIQPFVEGVGGAAWGDGYAYIPDGRNDVADAVRQACPPGSVTIERGSEIKPVDDRP
jgi:hypothetical protein